MPMGTSEQVWRVGEVGLPGRQRGPTSHREIQHELTARPQATRGPLAGFPRTSACLGAGFPPALIRSGLFSSGLVLVSLLPLLAPLLVGWRLLCFLKCIVPTSGPGGPSSAPLRARGHLKLLNPKQPGAWAYWWWWGSWLCTLVGCLLCSPCGAGLGSAVSEAWAPEQRRRSPAEAQPGSSAEAAVRVPPECREFSDELLPSFGGRI